MDSKLKVWSKKYYNDDIVKVFNLIDMWKWMLISCFKDYGKNMNMNCLLFLWYMKVLQQSTGCVIMLNEYNRHTSNVAKVCFICFMITKEIFLDIPFRLFSYNYYGSRWCNFMLLSKHRIILQNSIIIYRINIINRFILHLY